MGISKKSNIYTKKIRKPGLYMSRAMTGDHVTQPAFRCISFERLQCSMKC